MPRWTTCMLKVIIILIYPLFLGTHFDVRIYYPHKKAKVS